MSASPIQPQDQTAPLSFTREVWDKVSPETLAFLDCHETMGLLEHGQEAALELCAMDALIEEFESHIKRSPRHGRVRDTWQTLKEAVRIGNVGPQILLRFSRRTKIMLEQTRKNRFEASLMESLLNMGDLSALAPERLQDLEPHQAFLREMGRTFKCRSGDLAESVSSGLHVYLDEADTKKLLEQRAMMLEQFALKHGYHCVRRGSMSDISHGHSSQRVSRWTFIKI